MNPRTLSLTGLFGLRTLIGVPPWVHRSFGTVFIGKHTRKKDIDALYRIWFKYIMSHEQFVDMLDTYTNNDGYIVVHRDISGDQRIFSYRLA
jgi:hypothetical protein